MNFSNCLITGASSGIGRSIAIELSKISKHIYILGRNIDRLEEVNDKIISNNSKCTIVPLDLCEENGIENLAQEILKKDGYLDLLILSAGQIRQLSPISSLNLNDSKNIMNLNYYANLRMIRSFHNLLISSKNPRLAVISSEKNIIKNEYWGIYQPIMCALNELILTYASENKNTNLKANIYCPDSVNTRFRNEIMPGEDKLKLKSPDSVAQSVINHLIDERQTGKLIQI